MQGTYFLCGIIIAALVLWPEETANVFTAVGLKIQIFYINWRLKRMARKMHSALVESMTKPLYFDYDFEHGGKGWWEKLNRGWHEMYSYAPPLISPPEFQYTNLWDRD